MRCGSGLTGALAALVAIAGCGGSHATPPGPAGQPTPKTAARAKPLSGAELCRRLRSRIPKDAAHVQCVSTTIAVRGPYP
jgi:hypothetical protein